MQRRYLAALMAALVAIASLGLVACGGDDDDSGSSDSAASAEHIDGAFIEEMTAHHESAIEMAEIASERGQNPEIQSLAREIIASQGAEIAEMEQIHQRLFDAPVGEVEHDSLGLDADAMGMAHDPMTLQEVGDEEFDQEFIDMMIPHHQGAIRMARIELADGQDEELQRISEAIIEAQSREIEEMKEWREEWFGAPSPAGGVPSEGEEASSDSSMEGMEH